MGRDEQEAEAVLEEAALQVRWPRYFRAFGNGRSVPPNQQNGGPKEVAAQPASAGGIFSRITTLFGTALEAARSSEGIFTSSFFPLLFLVFMWGSALLTPCECALTVS